MADYYTYHKETLNKRRRRRAFIALLVVLVLLCGVAGFFWFERQSAALPVEGTSTPAEPIATAEATAEATPVSAGVAATPEIAATPAPAPAPGPATPEAAAPYTPARLLPAVDTAAWDTLTPVAQTIDTEYLNTDHRMVALPANGTVSTSYFDTVTFLGDSLTQGLELYDAGIKNAKYCAYKGIGPNSVVNGAACTDEIRGVTEVPLDALVATQPDYVYILFGTNSLVVPGSEEGFIAYFDKMIDMMRERLNPGVLYYIQAIPGVQEWVKDNQPGLNNERIRVVNDLLANLALRKGCYFVNLQEALTQPDGSQIDEFEVKDGIHMQPSGYAAWNTYLTTHTAWNRRTAYQGGNPYYILGT
ncbi:MAG: GDSL-type esterase/lipase family protein [Gemmiger sp.]|nr:GDSL-type esterase/lipase family protein [Gemmiger sp.]